MIAGDVYLDTNVYIDWADGERVDLLDAIRRSDVRVHTSVSTIFELLEDFWQARCPEQSQEALRALAALGLDNVLPSQNASLCRALDLPYETPRNVQAQTLREYVDFALRLDSEQRARGDDGRTAFNRRTFLAQLHERREQYIANLERFRDDLRAAYSDTGGPLTSQAVREIRAHLGSPSWAAHYARETLRQAGMDPSVRPAANVLALVGAAFEFDTRIVDLSLLQGYNLRSHRSDWFDSNQLANLAHPGITFVTADRRIYEWTRGTPQAERVVRASDCLR
jgi:hypothetical protein